jgi:hypothetical protein
MEIIVNQISAAAAIKFIDPSPRIRFANWIFFLGELE